MPAEPLVITVSPLGTTVLVRDRLEVALPVARLRALAA